MRLRQKTCLFSVCFCAAEVAVERYEEVNAEEGKTHKKTIVWEGVSQHAAL